MPYKDPEKRRECQRRYEATPARKAAAKQWRDENREILKAKKRAYFAKTYPDRTA